jgi:hypothetical protein
MINSLYQVYMLRKIWKMKKAEALLVLILIAASCKTNSIQKGVIDEFRITTPLTPQCTTIGFRVETKDASFKKIIKIARHYTVEIDGAFFNDSAFYMGKPEINLYEDNLCIITSGSCYFLGKAQSELDSIAANALKEVTVVVFCNDRKWIFKSSANSNQRVN